MSEAETKSETKPTSPSKTVVPGVHQHVVPTERCGALSVYVQGDLEEAHKEKDSKCVFLTMHDIGCNHSTIMRLIEHEAFDEIRKRAIFVHVDAPGHEENAADLPDDFTYPRVQFLGEDLVTVLDQLRIKYVIGLGEGAGANVIARFGMMHVARCLGVILIHPTSNKATMGKVFMEKFAKWKLTNIEDSGENRAIFRRFGHKLEDADDKAKAIEEFRALLGNNLNRKNMHKYSEVFNNRTDITPLLSKNLRCDALLVVGAKTSHVAAAEHMYSNMDKTKSSLLKVDDVGNVCEEAPIKLANSLLLFCKGLGWLTSVALPGVDRKGSTDGSKPQRQRSVSMEDYDKPNIRRLSITSKD